MIKGGLLTLITFVMFSTQASAGWFGASDWDECILADMPGVNNIIAAVAVRIDCRTRFSRTRAKDHYQESKESKQCFLGNAKHTNNILAANLIRTACRHLYGKEPVYKTNKTGYRYTSYEEMMGITPKSNKAGKAEVKTETKSLMTFEEFTAISPDEAVDESLMSFEEFTAVGEKQPTLTLHKLGGKIQAMFPIKPQDVGVVRSLPFSFQAYQHVDNTNSLVYTSGFQTSNVRYKQSNVQEAIKNFIKGNAVALSGSVLKLAPNKPSNGVFGSDYTMAYELQKNRVLKHGRVLYSDGRLYFWSIQEFPGSSTANGLSLFNKNSGKFRIIP